MISNRNEQVGSNRETPWNKHWNVLKRSDGFQGVFFMEIKYWEDCRYLDRDLTYVNEKMIAPPAAQNKTTAHGGSFHNISKPNAARARPKS